jgi:hypothetical protein
VTTAALHAGPPPASMQAAEREQWRATRQAKKAGYLLKKGPLKVRRMPGSRGGPYLTGTWCTGMAKALVCSRGRRTFILPQHRPGNSARSLAAHAAVLSPNAPHVVQQYQKAQAPAKGILSRFKQRGSAGFNDAEVILSTLTKGWEAAFRRFDADGSGSIDAGGTKVHA